MSIKKYGWQKIMDLRQTPVARKVEVADGTREQKILDALLPYSKLKTQSNLKQVQIENVTRNTSIAFVLLPEWAVNFPPYNLARLAAVAKQAGYRTHAYDLNAKANQDQCNWEGLDFNPWSGTRDWKWVGQSYWNDLHQYVEPFLKKYVDIILEQNFTAVGFCLYYCNAEPTKWMARELKRRRPDIKIIIGGPDTQNGYWTPEPEYDYIVTGEGEQMLLDILEHIESGKPLDKQMHIRQQEGERLNLDMLPAPDYSYFPPEDYGIPNGINFELSRGCIAKCVFCAETHFWKYRGRLADKVVNELVDLYYNRGVDVVWFLDSLVNGNLKELRAFCKGIIASGIKINWTGYARCDERMDLEFFQDLADSGCISLSFGIESGSEQILKDMDKGTTVAEIEQNLLDGARVGVEAFSTWIMGFPTERPQHVYETMTMMWRMRNSALSVIAAGGGFNIPPETIVAQHMARFGVAEVNYEGAWITKDFGNTKINRLIRLKSVAILLQRLKNERHITFGDRPSVAHHYQLEFFEQDLREIEYEQFDFNIINTGKGQLADSVVNEIWPLLRMLWRTRGAYRIQIQFDPQLDDGEFGAQISCDFSAQIQFEIDKSGAWTADFNYVHKQRPNSWHYLNFRGAKSVASDRARQLSGNTEVIEDFDHHYQTTMDQYKDLDLSFDYHYTGQGQW
jgi:hypothetical protein